MVNTSVYYINGDVIEKDFKKALYWLHEALQYPESSAQAMYRLAILYRNWNEIQKNLDLELEWLHKAAENKHTAAMFDLAVHYINATPTESKKAFSWFKQAADLNHKEASHMLGHAYENGLGTSKSITNAAIYYNKAISKKELTRLVKEADEFEKRTIIDVFSQKFGLLDNSIKEKFSICGISHEALTKDHNVVMLSSIQSDKHNLGDIASYRITGIYISDELSNWFNVKVTDPATNLDEILFHQVSSPNSAMDEKSDR